MPLRRPTVLLASLLASAVPPSLQHDAVHTQPQQHVGFVGGAEARLTGVTFRYLGEDASSVQRLAEHKWSVTTVDALPVEVKLLAPTGTVATMSQARVGGLLSLDATGAALPDDVDIWLVTDGGDTARGASSQRVVSEISIHTSCVGGGIFVGDTFGSLQVVGLSTNVDEQATGCSHGADHRDSPLARELGKAGKHGKGAGPIAPKKGKGVKKGKKGKKGASAVVLTSLTLRYLQSHARAQENSNVGHGTEVAGKIGKAGKEGKGGKGGKTPAHRGYTANGCLPAQVVATASAVHGGASNPVASGGSFTIEPAGQFRPDTYVDLADADGDRKVPCNTVHVPTSCGGGGGIAVGDVFGALEVVALSTTAGDSATHCGGADAAGRVGSTDAPAIAPAATAEPISSASASAGRLPADDSTAAPPGPPAVTPGIAARLPPADVGSLERIRLRYSGPVPAQGPCSNGQGLLGGAQWGFQLSADFANLPPATTAHLLSNLTHYVITPDLNDGTFDINIAVEHAGAIFFELFDLGTKVGECYFSTACSQSIQIGDRFGFLEVVDLTWEIDGCGTLAEKISDSSSDVCAVSTTVAPMDATPAPTAAGTDPANRLPQTTTVGLAAVGEVTTPVTTDTPFSGITTDQMTTFLPVSTLQPESQADLASCRVDLHDASDGQCTGKKGEAVLLNSSVGFTTQVCTTHQSSVSGFASTLYLTIQPATCDVDGKDPIWRVCSWQPEPSLCNDLTCCNPVDEYFDPVAFPGLMDSSCQEFREGDCAIFVGYNGSTPQMFSMELVRCNGAMPVDPGCQAAKRKAALVAEKEVTIRHDAENASARIALLVLGVGVMLLSLAMTLRRKRITEQVSGFERIEGRSHEPHERAPLWLAKNSVANIGDAEEDPYHFAGDLKGMLQATAPRQQAQPQPPSCRPVPPSEPELRASPLPDDECNYANQNDASEDWITTRELATFIEL